MAYEIIWLDEARKSLDAEMEYVFSNFGLLTLSEVYDDLHERVEQLKLFPRIGVRHEDLDYHGYEMRMLHVNVDCVRDNRPDGANPLRLE